ncbi:MAG: flagellar basal-body rod protein FlgF [Tranquillimonas sp.]|jgi:flagellar basal-body rod protein FlgF
MENSAYVSLSLASALRREMDLTANNIANANTTGFKAERMLFESYLRKEVGGSEGTNFVLDQGSYMDTRQGAIINTGNPLDLAIEGDAWFAYQNETGQRVYGRDGSFTIDGQGNLITSSGARVLDIGGAPIAVPPDLAGRVEITRNGTIQAPGAGALATVGLFDIPDLQSYRRLGAGMFLPPEGDQQPPLQAVGSRVVQGAVEGANVSPVSEMTRLISIQRAYERSVQLMNSGDDLRRDMLRRIGETQ